MTYKYYFKILSCVNYSSLKFSWEKLRLIFYFLTFSHLCLISVNKMFLLCINHTFLERHCSNRPE